MSHVVRREGRRFSEAVCALTLCTTILCLSVRLSPGLRLILEGGKPQDRRHNPKQEQQQEQNCTMSSNIGVEQSVHVQQVYTGRLYTPVHSREVYIAGISLLLSHTLGGIPSLFTHLGGIYPPGTYTGRHYPPGTYTGALPSWDIHRKAYTHRCTHLGRHIPTVVHT